LSQVPVKISTFSINFLLIEDQGEWYEDIVYKDVFLLLFIIESEDDCSVNYFCKLWI
jgi:hypothetical protein